MVSPLLNGPKLSVAGLQIYPGDGVNLHWTVFEHPIKQLPQLSASLFWERGRGEPLTGEITTGGKKLGHS
jgi:hypothetical protein